MAGRSSLKKDLTGPTLLEMGGYVVDRDLDATLFIELTPEAALRVVPQ